jgi:glutaredoxin-related protein
MVELIQKKDSISLTYWLKNENVEERNDFLKYSIHPTFPMYLLGDIFTFDIKKMNDSIFVLNNILSVGDSIGKNVISVFKVCAKNTDQGYKLFNYFDFYKSKLNTYNTDNVTFYYPCDFEFDTGLAETTSNFYNQLIKDFNLSRIKVNYILGENVDQGNNFIGFDYTVKTSMLKKAGLFIFSNIILSAQINHYHELVHAPFLNTFPKANMLLHEGIATYLGGASGYNFEFHLNKLKKILEENPLIDFTKTDELNEFIDDTNLYYTIGAIFIDYANQIGGMEKIRSLFQASQLNNDLFVVIENELGIGKDSFNDFIKQFKN